MNSPKHDIFSHTIQEPEKKWIVHIDLDAFYASVEERLHPEHKGKPIIVAPDPKKYKRGVVLTANYEARKFGVRSAMPTSKAYELCPEGIYLSSGFKNYGKASKEVMDIIKSWSSKFVQASIDEAYIDITDIVEETDPTNFLRKIQDNVISETGLSVSLGAAPTRTLAKIASDMQKPKGITIIYPEELPDRFNDMHLRKIPGIGKKTFPRLQKKGLSTIGQITKYPRIHWRSSVLLQYVWDLAHGLTSNSLSSEGYKSQSTSTERTFGEDISDPEELKNILKKLAISLLKDNIKPFQTLSIKVRLSNFKTFTRSKSFVRYLTDIDEELIFESIFEMFEEFLKKSNSKFRLLGVRFSNFKGKSTQQKPLTDYFQ
ncbi:MAG: DNA polymerase IV [Candidatus Heimdallarchaeota archaeon LC_3]|nr:MAG: DNA polymerase IV [Candidatus Heimdallarchaeota archaeon LC_3]